MILKRPSYIRISAIAVVAILFSASGFGLRMERFFYDTNVTLLNTHTPPEDMIIVAIDDLTFDVMADEMAGLKWPYPRAFHAQVLKHLAGAGAKAVFMDIIFDIESGFGDEDDLSLIQSMREIPTVLAAEYNETVRTPPIPKFLEGGAKLGNTSSPVDIDHLLRGMRGADALPGTFFSALDYFSGGLFFPSRKEGADWGIPTVEEALFQITHPGKSVPRPGYIYFHGPPGSFETVSWFEVYNPDLFFEHRPKFKDKVVLIGKTISASITPSDQPDIFPVPFGAELMAGVEIRANAYASLAHGRTRHLLDPLLFPIFFILFILVLIPLLSRAQSLFLCFFYPVLAGTLMIVCAGILFLRHTLFPIGPFLFFSIFYMVYTLGIRYIEERDRRVLVQAQLFNYLPERVARHVMANPQGLAMARDRTHITLLFADIAGFTTLSETFPPEVIIPLLQEHMKEMTQAIFDHEGTLDKYLGDGIMAFWGAPERQENHADLALQAAISMLAALEASNTRRIAKGIAPLKMRIGLHSGEAVVGNIGSELFIDYTAIGDNVNTASRIEGTGKYFDTRITISGPCIDALKGERPKGLFRLGAFAVKGRKEPLTLYTLSTEATEAPFVLFNEFLSHLDQGAFSEARLLLDQLLKTFPDFGPARFHHFKFETDGEPLWTELRMPYWRLTDK